jgi:hypothetical protein
VVTSALDPILDHWTLGVAGILVSKEPFPIMYPPETTFPYEYMLLETMLEMELVPDPMMFP